eukprot:362322-Chlamydomonas_euryale.AAC.8
MLDAANGEHANGECAAGAAAYSSGAVSGPLHWRCWRGEGERANGEYSLDAVVAGLLVLHCCCREVQSAKRARQGRGVAPSVATPLLQAATRGGRRARRCAEAPSDQLSQLLHQHQASWLKQHALPAPMCDAGGSGSGGGGGVGGARTAQSPLLQGLPAPTARPCAMTQTPGCAPSAPDGACRATTSGVIFSSMSERAMLARERGVENNAAVAARPRSRSTPFRSHTLNRRCVV